MCIPLWYFVYENQGLSEIARYANVGEPATSGGRSPQRNNWTNELARIAAGKHAIMFYSYNFEIAILDWGLRLKINKKRRSVCVAMFREFIARLFFQN